MALPPLIATLTARIDGFLSAMQRAERAAGDASRRISNSFDSIKGLVGGLAGALSVAAFTNLVKGSIDAADNINDLSKKTGIAVETLGGLGFAAEQSGGNLESVGAGMGKLNKSLAEAASGNEHASEAFKVLGVAVTDAAGQTIKADVVLANIADKFATFPDGPEKAALALRIFGKAGAEMIPLLDEGGESLRTNIEYFRKHSGATQELSERSDQFNDVMVKLQVQGGSFRNLLANALLPTLQTVVEAFLDSAEKGGALKSVAEALATGFNLLAVAAASSVYSITLLTNEMRALLAQAAALARLDFTGFVGIGKIADDDLESNRKKYKELIGDLNKAREQIGSAGAPPSGDKIIKPQADASKFALAGRRPASKSASAATKVDDLDKKLLDQELKTLEGFIADEKSLLQSRETLFGLHFQSDELSIRDYFAKREVALQASVDATKAIYQDEIAAVEDYIAKTQKKSDPKSEGRVIEAQTRIIEIRKKLADVEEDAAEKTVKDWFDQRDAIKKYGDKLNELSAQVLELKGDTTGAFKIRFEIQQQDFKKQLVLDRSSADPAVKDASARAEANLAQSERLGISRAKLNDIESERAGILSELANQHERISIAVSTGASTELQALAALSDANKKRLASLSGIVEAYQRIADESDDPAASIAADRLRVELERLASQTDLVADKFREIGVSATESFIDKLLTGTVTLKDAFRALVKDITAELNKVASREISTQIFGKGGILSSVPSVAASVLGPKTKGGGEEKSFADSAGSIIQGVLSKIGFGKTATPGMQAGMQAGDTGAFDISGSAGASATTAAANDAAFTQLTASVTSSNAAMSALGSTTPAVNAAMGALGATTPIVDTALSAVSTTTTTTLATSFLALGTAATTAATALSTLAASSAVSGAASSGSSYASLLASMTGSANGNVFASGNVVPFARGGSLVDRPTYFPMAQGKIGLMGEAGPEAIMPLKKAMDGRLGVAMFAKGLERIFPLSRGPDGKLGITEFAKGGVFEDESKSGNVAAFTAYAKGGVFDTGGKEIKERHPSVTRFAKGGVFDRVEKSIDVIKFARGGIVEKPTMFELPKHFDGGDDIAGNVKAFARGGVMGLMGEDGPEAIMPLRRGKDGKLGIAAPASVTKVTNVNINYQAGPGESMRTASQRGAELARQLRIAGVRNG